MSFESRVIFLASIGFAEGMLVGVLITSVLTTMSIGDGTLYLCTPAFTAFVGDPLMAFVVQAVTAGFLGTVAMGTSAVYSIEEWSLLKATLIHFVVTMTTYFLVAFFLRWLSPADIKYNLTIFAILVAVYFMIWLYNFLSYKAQINEINRELKEWKLAEGNNEP
ncbi:MAG: DUF3021 domain-containing protein [Lachnospiraceae bacterium]|nr:DUF3021 domain-containing protein [Lachnospiraceae bacterium]